MGVNVRSSLFSGIDQKKIKIFAYVFCGFCAGIAGLIGTSNISTSDATSMGLNLELDAILARWLATNPHLLILDEPTRGIDVGAKAEIQKLVLSLAEEGKSCMFISSELEEVLRTCHRIVVMRGKKKIAEYGGDVGDQKIMQAIAGSE